MDSGLACVEEFDACLRQIEAINYFTGGYRPIFQWAKTLPDASLTIADIGCGRGDLLRRLRRRYRHFRLQGIDINPWSKRTATNATPASMDIHYLTADILQTKIAADFIVCSHMTHHLDDAALVIFLKKLDQYSTRGWFICDLHRHPLPYLFIRYVLALIPLISSVLHDGTVSVRRAFTRREWERLLEQAGIPLAECSIEWFFPFRYGIARRKI